MNTMRYLLGQQLPYLEGVVRTPRLQACYCFLKERDKWLKLLHFVLKVLAVGIPTGIYSLNYKNCLRGVIVLVNTRSTLSNTNMLYVDAFIQLAIFFKMEVDIVRVEAIRIIKLHLFFVFLVAASSAVKTTSMEKGEQVYSAKLKHYLTFESKENEIMVSVHQEISYRYMWIYMTKQKQKQRKNTLHYVKFTNCRLQ